MFTSARYSELKNMIKEAFQQFNRLDGNRSTTD